MKRTKLRKRSKSTIAVLKRKAQEVFNKWIIRRDKLCVRCGGMNRLTASHYFNEGIYGSVRYDPENADALCWLPCHIGNVHISWEYRKQSDYKDFKLRQLGEERFKELEKRAREIHQYTRLELESLINLYR